MTDPGVRLAAIRGRLDNATPGPWHGVPMSGWSVEVRGDWRDDRGPVAEVDTRLHQPDGACNADLIANAPADLAYLLGIAEAARAYLAEIDRWHFERPAVGQPPGWPFQPGLCDFCNDPWPCENARVVESLRRALWGGDGAGD